MKLYVGGLAYATTDEELKEYFAQAGEVTEATVIKDRDNGNRSKGFGFVEFANDDDAKKAIADFDGKEFMGRTLSVAEARAKKSNDGGRRFGGDRGGDRGYHQGGNRGGAFRQRSF